MIVLGSTGSIGVNTLVVAKKFGIKVEALIAGKNIKLLNQQIKEFDPKYVVIADENDLHKVSFSSAKVGAHAILDVLKEAKSELVVNALVGFAGLAPTIKAQHLGKKVALANKESLVTAGAFLDTSKLTPIDSEHFALWYLLQNKPIESMIITASGGSFRDLPIEKLENVSIADALNHPNWKMGSKITIDSATMTNKIFEILEAFWFFGVKKLDAIIETKSLMHAMINFKDGSSTAHFANADMKLPISYALMGKVEEEILNPVNLVEVGSLEFRKIETNRYPIWSLKDELLQNPKQAVIVNAANEIGVERFLAGKIGFNDIAKNTLKAYEKFGNIEPKTIDDVFEIDKMVRSSYVF